MSLNLDSSVYVYLGIIVLLLGISFFLKEKKFFVIKIIIRFVFGGVFIYLFNFLGKLIGITIPLNPITALLTGILEIPGFFLILVIKYAIYG